MTLQFPNNFLWGTATAAHQVEGANANNDWWDWEQTPGHIHNDDTSARACEWWAGRYAEDFDRARDLHTNAHRMSVEWSRIEPREGEWDDAALSKYRAMLEALRARQIIPFVTLHHFTNPLWLMAKGGWLNDDTPRLFEHFATRVVETLGDLTNFWFTINEPGIYVALNYMGTRFPPGANSLSLGLRVARNLIRGHAAAFHAIHRVQSAAQVGLAHHFRRFVPANPRSPLDSIPARIRDYMVNRLFVRATTAGIIPFPDFFGVNYYSADRVAFDLACLSDGFGRSQPNEWLRGTQYADWLFAGDVAPECFYEFVQESTRFRLPIYVTENGVFDIGGDAQARYLVSHLHALHRAIQAGADVRGYFWWTLTDNFEWADGYWLKFGLYALDVETQTRTPRLSAEVYRQIARANAISDELLMRYG
jgi:beta-glucosidase